MHGPTRRLALAAAPLLMVAAGRRGDEIACPGADRAWLVPFASAPFPYDGDIPGGGPFLDRRDGDRRGHTSPRGGLYWEDPTYADSRVLLAVPPHVRSGAGARIVLFLHGNGATLERDVCRRQGVPRQLAASGLDAVLVAPQLAVDAQDSSAGKLWQPGGLKALLDEAAQLFAERGVAGLAAAPVIVVAYSGGYLPAVFGAEVGGIGGRLQGLVLLDALFGEVDRYADLIAGNAARTFFVSAYTGASRGPNEDLRRRLAARGVATGEGLPPRLRPGTVAFVPASAEVTHGDFMTRGFVRDPLAAALRAAR